MIDHVATVMAQLPDPTPPASLKATVMARIAREADRQHEFAAERAAPVRRPHERLAWIWALAAGVMTITGASLYGWRVSGALPDMTSPLIGRGMPALIPMEGSVA